MQNISAVIWDFDGVIADTEPAQAQSYANLLRRRGISVETDFFTPYIGRTESEIWEGIRETYDLRDSIESLRTDRLREFLDVTSAGVGVAWYVPPMFAFFAGARHTVVSSGNQEVVESLVVRWGLGARFDSIRAWVPGEPASDKENTLAEEVARTGECIVVEDSTRYLRQARRLGAHTIGVRHSLNGDGEIPCDLLLEMSAVHDGS